MGVRPTEIDFSGEKLGEAVGDESERGGVSTAPPLRSPPAGAAAQAEQAQRPRIK